MSAPTGGKVAVLARIPAQPGKRDALVEALQAAIDNANTEAGTLLYILHTDPKDPDAVLFYELYADQDALTAHGSSDRFKEIGATLREFAAGRPELTMLTPVIGKGL
ncbi:putative quinol monooxygenase [Pseudonocardia humida]|uniref:Antibiotic biosynthesis monooxygenase n=1 Tax=Pseudonocardia humida TaxID=2800819 RepID=A0ABT1AB46_9PSEU|nr:putative quinol monooxygenase [Pseudonocardia humida]MCO1660255.1 antibiotic biosynthesis monooxygenase [Pseudonocardia humida]